LKKGSGKQKGNSFERLIATKLSLWLTDNKANDTIWRTDTSGGRSTINLKKNNITDVVKNNIGDLKQVLEKNIFKNLDEFFNIFFVELKIGYSDVFLFYLPLNKTFLEIVDKCIEQSKINNKFISLIVKPDRKKEMFITNYKFNVEFKNNLSFKHKEQNFYIYVLEDLISINFERLISGGSL
jgi:hypothetical protein